jgi:hypothetical protein
MQQTPVALCCNSAVLFQVGREARTFGQRQFPRGRAESFFSDVCVAFFTACSQAGGSLRLARHTAPNRLRWRMSTSNSEASTRAAAEVAGGGPALLVPCLQPAMRAGPSVGRSAGRSKHQCRMSCMRPGALSWVARCRVHVKFMLHVTWSMRHVVCCMLHRCKLHAAPL